MSSGGEGNGAGIGRAEAVGAIEEEAAVGGFYAVRIASKARVYVVKVSWTR